MTDQQVVDPTAIVDKERAKALRLFGLSFLMLFLELALIRWLGANVLYLGYFSNLILLGSFLGIGMAFLIVKPDRRWVHALPLTLLALVGLVLTFPIEVSRSSSSVIFFGHPELSGLPIWLVVPVIFALVVAMMAMVAHEVALAFAQLSPLSAYGWDISGSLLGIVGFTALSYLRAPPLAWGIVVVASLLFLMRGWQGRDYVSLAGIVLLLGVQTFAPGLSWSPYYQIMVSEIEGVSHISVNGIPHQAITSVSDLSATFYNLPYEFVIDSAPDRVLVVGAGSGNDVALALAHGASSVDAVEIDPTIQQLGEELHPDRPYADPRVEAVIDDGRAFMQQSPGSYDLIIFALPDSLT
ncbi:MAG: spermidine synthase, partial [Acidimicrobiia bacterium]